MSETSPQYLFPLNIDSKYAYQHVLHSTNPSAEKMKHHYPLPRPQDHPPNLQYPGNQMSTRTGLNISRNHVQGDHLSPQYLHPPNPSNHTADKSPSITTNFRVQVHGGLSPHYLHPLNMSSKPEISSKKTTPRYAPGTLNFSNTTEIRAKVHAAHLSPQYLYPPNSRETQGVSQSIETMASSISSSKNPPPRQVLFQQKLSPQYLYPPGDIDKLQWEINPPSTVPRFQQRIFFNFPCGNLFDTYSRSSTSESNTETGDHLSLQHLHQPKPSSENNPELALNLGDRLSPQYLFPPNFWSSNPPSEFTAKNLWGVAALSARLRAKPIEINLWSLNSLLVRLRYCQRPPFIFSKSAKVTIHWGIVALLVLLRFTQRPPPP